MVKLKEDPAILVSVEGVNEGLIGLSSMGKNKLKVYLSTPLS